MKTFKLYRKTVFCTLKTILASMVVAAVLVSCTAGDKGDDKVADSVSNEPTGNQNPTAVGEAGPSIPADTAAAGNEPKTTGQ